MKLKELTLTSTLIAALIAQNYLLYYYPITLTYVFLYFISRNIKSNTLNIFSVLLFVLIKNIIYMAFIPTILFDIVGLLLVLYVSKIKKSYIRYIIMVVSILVHILLLDFSVSILSGDIIKMLIANIISGFITYIYAPLSIIIIITIDKIDILVEKIDY